MRKNYLLKTAVVLIAVLFGFSAASAQDEEGPKLVNLTEIVNPVIGENGPEPFPLLFRAAEAWGDFNNDGYLDLLMFGAYQKYFEFDEDGEPIPNIDEDGNELPLTYNVRGLSGGNITSDSWQGINCTRLYKNNGDGTFTQVPHPFPHLCRGGIAWLDYDNDGNLDVIMLGQTVDGRYTGIFRNQGADNDFAFVDELPGEFENLHVEGDIRPSRVIAVADYDNDGWVDVLLNGRSDTPNEGGRTVSLYRNLEGQGFQKMEYLVDGERPLIRHNGGSIAWGDFNNDGFLDLITFGYLAGGDQKTDVYPEIADIPGGAVLLYKNNGDGTFSFPDIFPAGEDGEIAFGDFNNNGYLDFIFGNYSWWPSPWNGWQSFIYMNNGDGTFEAFNHEAAGIRGDQGISLALGDVNNDGYEDIVNNKGYQAAVFFNNEGELPFVRQNFVFAQTEGTNNLRAGAISLVDIDNNGALDIFANGRNGSDNEDADGGIGITLMYSHLWKNDLDEAEGIPFNQPPSAPSNLQATVDADGFTVFTWDPATDDLTPQIALRYNLYVKQGDVISMVLPADLTTGRLKVNDALAPIMGTTYKMWGLDGEYEWGVQAIDNGKMGGKFAVAGQENSIRMIDNKIAVNVVGKKGAIELRSTSALQGTVSVYSISGMNLYTQTGQINGATVDLPASGVYIVKVASPQGISVQKVVVK